jgi:hypothetical protein
MTTLELYRKHKNGEVSREKFLYEVRRDNNLPFITNLTSYDDAVKILKNKGIVTEVDTKEAKADEAVKAEIKAKAPSTKKPKELHIDYANPYEYRHGLQYELDKLDDYSDEALEKAKSIVLKNLAKDANFYSSLLNQQQSHYQFKQTETDKPGMQANADGHLKKEAKKDEKSNVQDSLGKKEAGKKKPKGIKIMPDKGVTGSEKTIKEGVDDKVEDMIKSGEIKPEEVKAAAEKAMKGDSTSLVALMAGLKLAEDTMEEGIKGNFDDDDNTYTYDHLINTDSPSKEQLKNVLNIIKKDKEELEKKGKKTKVVKGDTVPYLELVETVKEDTLTEVILKIYNYDASSGGLEDVEVEYFGSEDEAKKAALAHHWQIAFDNGDTELSKDEFVAQTDFNDLQPYDNYGYVIAPDKGGIKEDMEEGSFMGGVDLGSSSDMNAEDQFAQLMDKYDWYYEMSDDPRAYDRGTVLDKQLKTLGKQIGADKAVAMFNAKAPSDRKVTNTFFMEGEDKHAKIKEALKKALKEADPTVTKLEKDIERKELEMADLMTKQATILKKPGTQG